MIQDIRRNRADYFAGNVVRVPGEEKGNNLFKLFAWAMIILFCVAAWLTIILAVLKICQ